MMIRGLLKYVYRALFYVLVALLTACTREAPPEIHHSFEDRPSPGLEANLPVYRFGVFPLHNPIELAEIYEPFTDYINRRKLGFLMKFETAPSYGAHELRVMKKSYDFAILNPYQALHAQTYGYRIFAKLGSDNKFSGVLVVRRDSPIKSFSDLKGKTISLASPTALAGTMMVRVALKEKGVDILKDMKVKYVNSLDSPVLSVASGDSDVGGTSYSNYEAVLAARPELRDKLTAFWNTSTLPNLALVVAETVPGHIVDELRRIFSEHGNNRELGRILKAMRVTAIVPASEESYQPVNRFLIRYKNLFAELPLTSKSQAVQ